MDPFVQPDQSDLQLPLSASSRVPLVIAEDDPDIRETLVMIGEDVGFAHIMQTTNGPDTLLDLQQAPQPCVVALDWHLPGLNGGALLRARAAETPIFGRHAYLILTADLRVTDHTVQALQLPLDMAVHVLHKPYDLDTLRATLIREATRLAALTPMLKSRPNNQVGHPADR